MKPVIRLLARSGVTPTVMSVVAFGGYRFGGSLLSPVADREVPIESGVVFAF